MPDQLRNWLHARRVRNSQHEDLIFQHPWARRTRILRYIGGLQSALSNPTICSAVPNAETHPAQLSQTYATMEMLIHGATPEKFKQTWAFRIGNDRALPSRHP